MVQTSPATVPLIDSLPSSFPDHPQHRPYLKPRVTHGVVRTRTPETDKAQHRAPGVQVLYPLIPGHPPLLFNVGSCKQRAVPSFHYAPPHLVWRCQTWRGLPTASRLLSSRVFAHVTMWMRAHVGRIGE